MVYRETPQRNVTVLKGAGVNQDTASPYWEGSSAAEAAKTNSGWNSHVNVPTVSVSDDPRGIFTPVAGGIQFNFPGTYEVEVTGHHQGGAVGAREGITFYTTGGIVPLMGAAGNVLGGHLVYAQSVSSARYTTAIVIVNVTTAGAQVKFQDYNSTTTSHTCTLTRIRATKIIQGGPGPQGQQGIQGIQGPVGTRWGYTNVWAFADATDIAVDMFDGGDPAVGDMIMSLNGFSVGDVYIVTAVYPVTGNVDVMYNSPAINLRGPMGPRWGTVNVSFPGAAGATLAGVACTFPDGGLPKQGDIIQNLHGDHLGDVYFVDSVVFGVNSATLKKYTPLLNIRGATGPAGSALSHWPVDSVYISFANVNPATYFGGTWASIGAGRMLIGVDSADAAMDAAGDTGGAKTVTLAAANLPQHTHTINHDHGNGTVSVQYAATTATGGTATRVTDVANVTGGSGTSGTAQISLPAYNGNTGSGNSPISATPTPVTNLPPYLAVYMWRRTA